MGLQSPPSKLVRGLAKGKQLKFTIALTTPMSELIIKAHQPSAQGALVLTRTATAVALLSSTLKDRQQIGIQVNGDGPLGEVYAIANHHGEVRVTAHHPEAEKAPIHNVGAVVGEGRFTLIKTSATGEPYRGTVPIFTGGIAEDLAYYFMFSEQVPTACGIGEALSERGFVASGGYLVQALPNTEDEVLGALESKVVSLPPLQDLLLSEAPAQLMLYELFGEDFEILEESEVRYHCPCQRERYARSLLTLGKEELTKLRDEEESITLSCHFCASEYSFNRQELSALILGAR